MGDSVRRDAQRTYNPKFVAYLARLLLNFDRASQSWWQEQTNRPFVSPRFLANNPDLLEKQTADFQRLQASVSLGLRAFQSPDGVRELFELLRTRFGGTEAGDRQLALLFSLMGEGQPTSLIAELVASTDNARVTSFVVEDPGSGYDPARPPLVSVTAGAASGRMGAAVGQAVLALTGRVYALDVAVGGYGYQTAPAVTIAPPSAGGRRAHAQAILKNGVVDSVVVTDAGEGYTDADEPLRVTVEPPMAYFEQLDTLVTDYKPRTAIIRGRLDVGISQIEVVSQGRGYGLDLPCTVVISAPLGSLRPRVAAGAAAAAAAAAAVACLAAAAERRPVAAWSHRGQRRRPLCSNRPSKRSG